MFGKDCPVAELCFVPSGLCLFALDLFRYIFHVCPAAGEQPREQRRQRTPRRQKELGSLPARGRGIGLILRSVFDRKLARIAVFNVVSCDCGLLSSFRTAVGERRDGTLSSEAEKTARSVVGSGRDRTGWDSRSIGAVVTAEHFKNRRAPVGIVSDGGAARSLPFGVGGTRKEICQFKPLSVVLTSRS